MPTPATNPTAIPSWLRGRMLSGALLVAASALGHAWGAAATQDLVINVTLTIPADISVFWCNSAGHNGTPGNDGSTAAQSWAMGTAIALDTVYYTTLTGAVAATPTVPALRYIKNKSNCEVDIEVSCSNSTSWSVVADQSLADNTFEMGARQDQGSFTSLHTTVTAWINALASGQISPEIGLRLKTPRAITVGGGKSQSIVVTFTATPD